MHRAAHTIGNRKFSSTCYLGSLARPTHLRSPAAGRLDASCFVAGRLALRASCAVQASDLFMSTARPSYADSDEIATPVGGRSAYFLSLFREMLGSWALGQASTQAFLRR